MIKVKNFRAFSLYQKSLELLVDVNKAGKIQKGKLSELEYRLLQNKAMCITSNISSAISQVNMKVQFKKLNQAKATLLQLRSLTEELLRRNKLDKTLGQQIIFQSIEVMKLLNGFFGWQKKQKEQFKV
jgi:hypothetical protein